MTRRKTDFFLQLRLFGICMPKSYQVPLIGFEHKAVYTDARGCFALTLKAGLPR